MTSKVNSTRVVDSLLLKTQRPVFYPKHTQNYLTCLAFPILKISYSSLLRLREWQNDGLFYNLIIITNIEHSKEWRLNFFFYLASAFKIPVKASFKMYQKFTNKLHRCVTNCKSNWGGGAESLGFVFQHP